jgi:hypothetical protein
MVFFAVKIGDRYRQMPWERWHGMIKKFHFEQKWNNLHFSGREENYWW